jgi:hypothetical protein
VKAVNLIPPSQRQPSGGLPNRSGGVAYVVLGGVACIGGLAALYGLAEREVASKEGEAVKLEAQARALQARASGLAAYKAFIALRQQRETEILSLINSRFNWAHLLAELSADLPRGATVTNVSGTIGGPSNGSGSSSGAPKGGAVGSSTPPGSLPSLALSGCAPSGGGLPKVLSRLRLIEGVRTVELKSGTKTGGTSSTSTAGCASGEYSFSITVSFSPMPTPPTAAKAVVVPGAGAPRQPTALPKGGVAKPHNVSLTRKGGKEGSR